MSAESKFRRERPYAAAVLNLNKNAEEAPMVATPIALFAIAYAILDHSEAVRAHTDATSKETTR